MESGPPRNGVRAAPKWSKGRPEMESGSLIFSSRFFSFLLILSSMRGESCTILTSVKNLLYICQHVELVNYPFNTKTQEIKLSSDVVSSRNLGETHFCLVWQRVRYWTFLRKGKTGIIPQSFVQKYLLFQEIKCM